MSRPESEGGKKAPYSPLIGRIDDQLLDPPDFSDVAKHAVYYGIKHIDKSNPAGINMDGTLIVILGAKKERKTTLALNVVRNLCKQEGRLNGKKILWETLESGQSPKKVKQALICMEATAYMAGRMWGSIYRVPKRKKGADEYSNMMVVRDARDPAYAPEGPGNLFHLSVPFAMSMNRTPLQREAIEYAVASVNDWPLLIYGAPVNQGWTKTLESVSGKALRDLWPYKRWLLAVEKYDVGVIVIDHTNAYTGSNDYDRQQIATTHGSAAVSELGVAMIAVCQPSRASVVSGEPMVRGGDKWAEEANLVIRTKYEQNADCMDIKCLDAREAPFPDLRVPLEKRSGLIFPDSYPL